MKANAPVLQVIIRETDGILWEGKASSFSSINEIGAFDILPQHSHFVGSIKDFIIVKGSYKEKKWDIKTGIISVVDGIIEVFLGY